MFKRIISFAILVIFFSHYSSAQNYIEHIHQGEKCFSKGDYISAFEQFDFAYKLANTKTKKSSAQTWKNKSKEKIKQQQRDLQNALQKAEEMQRKFETAMFDKAVKEHDKEWIGYDRYNWKMTGFGEDQNGKQILQSIDTLDLSKNTLQRIPSEVTQCPNLKHLNLLGNKHIDWKVSSEILAKLPETASIYISIEDLDNIPKRFHHKITGIQLVKTGINAIPANILKLKQITYLDVSGELFDNNYFDTLSPKLLELDKLQFLYLSNCQIKTLPAQIGKLTNLSILDLSYNEISDLPAEIGTLTNLTRLDLSHNKLCDLPAQIGKLTNLAKLVLHYNQISNLPAQIRELANLSTLDLGNNKLSNLPAQIGELTNLLTLNLSYNKISDLPVEIGKLTHLSSLDLSHNEISELPAEIGKLLNLTKLVLHYNQISNLPAQIGELTNLSNLDLYNNKIIKLPAEIGALLNLSRLSLGSNQLSRLPTEIGGLSNLLGLYLHFNQISNLPAQIKELSNLKELNLFSNQLNELPAEIGALTNLLALDLGSNQLSDLPAEIWELTNLTRLHLYNNQINYLPSKIGKLTNLKWLALSKNPLSELPSEIFNLGIITKSWDEIRGQLLKAKNYEQTYKASKKITQLNPENYNPHFNLSWYALLAQKPKEAISAALKSLELAPQETGVYTNLALGYLLDNQWNKARKIYLELKNKRFPRSSRTWQEVFLKDINELEKAGIKHKDFEKARQLLNSK